MRGFILLSCAMCLAVARPQSGYNYGPTGPALQSQGAAQLSLPIQQAPANLGTASGQLDQATLDILRQLPLVPTSSSFLLHESHQTLTNAGSNAYGGGNAFSSGLNELNSAPIQAQLGGISPIQVASSAQTPQQPQYSPAPQPQYSPAPQPQYSPAPQPQAQHAPALSYGPAASSQGAAQLSLPIQQIPIPAQPAPQQSFQQFVPQPAAPQPRAPSQSYGPVPQQALPQAQFAPQPLGPSPADIAPSHLAPSSSSAAPSAPAAPLQLAPAQASAPAQPSGLYQTADFPEPITTIHKHIYVHVPPPDFEEELPAPRVRAEPANNQKHVQILFIKAPAPPTPKPIEFPPLATNEEKTLVYVLVRKPEQPEDIVPPQTPEPKVNKPEVFFIKYQGDKDQPQGYGSDAPSDAAGLSDATVTNAADLSEPRSAEPAPSAQPSEQPAAPSLPAASDSQQSSSPSSSSSSGAPDRKYIPAA